MRELEVIRAIREGVATRNPAVRLGIGDDCAILKPAPNNELVVTTDFCIEGRHFRRDWHTAESVGHRCLARGLSDVAAMGARPISAFLSLALPKGFDVAWFKRFMWGFERLASEQNVELAGGDTSEAPGDQMIADIVAIGTIERGKAIRRAGARVGDGLFVTGSLGGSAAELAAIREGREWGYEVWPQRFPEPQVRVGMTLAKRGYATACIDVSDGLSTDLRHLCEASGVRAEVDAALLPLGPEASLEQALHGGEDYELLFTVMAGVKMPQQMANVKVTRIGTILGGDGPLVVMKNGEELKAGGWEHL
jgi:thiamine-monophosphate kinase